MNKIMLKWVVAHEPVQLFIRTAEAFAAEVEKISNGRFGVEILTVEDYEEKYNNGEEFDPYVDMFPHLDEGKIDITQSVVSNFGRINSNFFALDLPFLFEDHDHAARVYEGKIGKALCDSLAESSNMQGLAFTYSGGYRIMGAAEPLHSIDQIQGMPVRCGDSPVSYLTIKALGADPKPSRRVGHTYDSVRQGIFATESTYLRFKGTHAFNTAHSMFMTTIAISKEVWGKLDIADQELLQAAATAAAKVERQWSINDAAEFERNCEENGVEIYQITEEETEKMKQRSKSVYIDSAKWFHPDLVDSIKKA